MVCLSVSSLCTFREYPYYDECLLTSACKILTLPFSLCLLLLHPSLYSHSSMIRSDLDPLYPFRYCMFSGLDFFVYEQAF